LKKLLIQLNGTSSKNGLNLSTLDQVSSNGAACSIKTSPVASLTIMALPLLSGVLFVIAMELLAQSIRWSEDITSIRIQGNEEVKLTQYADDTTALLADVQSVSNLFDLLSLFEKSSGLKINQATSEMLCLGSMHHRKNTICNLQISDDPLYALGCI